MSNGGIHDHIGHGFARYSVTPDWSLPHFEKMLYDNAQLLSVYLDAYLVSQDNMMLDTALDIAEYLVNDALLDRRGGAFYSAEDADSLYKPTDTEKRGKRSYRYSLIRHEQDFTNHFGFLFLFQIICRGYVSKLLFGIPFL